MDTIVNTRICIICEERKSLSEFNLKSGEKFVYESACKDCQKEKLLEGPEDLSYIKTEKEIIDTQTHLETPFPEKETPNKTSRKLRIP